MAKSLPNAMDIEQSLLGNFLVYPESTRIAVESGLVEDDFFLGTHKKIFKAISEIYSENKDITLPTVTQRLIDTNMLDSIGGQQCMLTITDKAVSLYNTKEYVEIIKGKSFVRNMIEAAQNIVDEGLSGQVDIDNYLDKSEKAILDISRNRMSGGFKNSYNLVNDVISEIKKRSESKSTTTGLKTGFEDLDRVTHGFQRGDLIILAARPSVGKTAVALNFATKIAQYHKNEAVAIFSLEMQAEQLMQRILSSKSQISGNAIATGKLSDSEWGKLNEAAYELRNVKMYFDDSSIIKVPEMFSKCRKLQVDEGLSCILIDYIQLISGSNKENRQQDVSEISRNLKALARELNVPVIALSQLSRSVEGRAEKRPMLSDLRESGALEQDADIVMLLYRDDYYNKKEEEANDNKAVVPLEINIAKHRNGSTGVLKFAFQGATSTIYSTKEND